MSKPIIPWMGGKRRLARHIVPLFQAHQCYVEPFAGAAGVFFSKEPSGTEVLNDVNGDIINLYRIVKHHPEELHKQFKWLLVSRENWRWFKETPVETLTDVQKAARFLYVQKLAFGAKAVKPTFGTITTGRPRLNLFSLEQDLSDAHERLAGAVIERLDWQEAVRRYDRPHTLFYLDPPYWELEGYGVPFEWSQYQALAALLKGRLKGKAVLSINDHPDVRELFNGLPVIEVEYRYTVGGGAKQSRSVELIYQSL